MDPLFAQLAALALASSGASPVPGIVISDQRQMSDTVNTAQSAYDPLDRYNDILWSRKYAEALAFASSLSGDNLRATAIIDAMRAAALIGLRRDSEARHLIDEAHRLAPDAPESSSIIFNGALISDRMEFAADALDRLIARAPDAVREIDTNNMHYFLQKEPSGETKRNQDRRIALARIGYGGETPTGHYMAAKAVDLLVGRGDFSGAQALLPHVLDPTAIEDMLINRRYAPLWPNLAKIAGPNLEFIRKASADAAQLAYDEAPDDHEKLENLVNALREAGQLNAAIALRSKLPHDAASMSSADEQMGWAINNVALALHDAGRADEADRLFASLNDAPMPKEYWRISMKINRLEFLVKDGKFERALPLIEPTAKIEGTPYADQLTRRLRYCTLRRLGRSEEAAKYLPELMAHAGDAVVPTIDGLLCAGEIDKAQALALAQLKNPDEDKRINFEKQFVRALQARPLTSDDPSVWQGAWRQLRQRPAIAAEFKRLGRDMPENLLPPRPDGR
jgi:hypothetical protein